MNITEGGKKRRPILNVDSKAIRIWMITEDVSVTELAEEVRKKTGAPCSQPFMSMLIAGQRSSKDRRIEKFLARKMGVPVEELFPRDEAEQAA